MKKIIIIVIPILIILSFILILNRDKNLENYKGTTLNDSKEVKKIIGKLEIDNSGLIINKTNNSIELSLNKRYDYYLIEKYSNTLLYLINDLDYIKTIYEDSEYIINKNMYFNSIDDINSYYSDKYFDEYTYMGTIKNYKVFDKSDMCTNEKQYVGKDDKYNYSVFCSNINNIYLVSKDEISLGEAISSSIVNIEDIKKLNIKIIKEEL